MLKWLAEKLNSFLGINTVQTQYLTKWEPKPNGVKMAEMLRSIEFKAFMDYCKEKSSLQVAVQNKAEDRNEMALLMQGVFNVEIWAEDFVLTPTTAPDHSESLLNLSDDQLLKEISGG